MQKFAFDGKLFFEHFYKQRSSITINYMYTYTILHERSLLTYIMRTLEDSTCFTDISQL